MNAIDELLKEIFDSRKPAFYPEFEAWVRESRRFKAFAGSQRTKIRSKLRNARDEHGLKDLRAELETAALLLREEGFALEYEKYMALKQRGPDLTVTFKGHTLFNVEVRRVRSTEWDDDPETRNSKLMRIFTDKVGQMPAGMVNLLWLTAERQISEDDLSRAAQTIRQLAEHKNEDFFTRRGFKNAADFLKQYQQLSGIVLHRRGENVVWLNSLARHKTPPDIVRAIQRLESHP